MKIVSRVLAPLLLVAALPAASVLAEVGEGGNHRFNAEMQSRLEDGRLAMVKTALKLTDAQSKLWAPVEDMIRQEASARGQHRHDGRHEGRRGDETRAEASLPDRLDKASAKMTERAAQMKAYATALRPLYDSFSDEQKQIAGPLLAGLVGGGGGHGEGRHGGGHGWHHGGDRDRGPAEGAAPDKG